MLRILTLSLCLLFAFTVSSFAEDGDGNGGGNGANRDIPLTLVDSSVADGQGGVAVNVTIEMDFNKNVCNVTELADNSRCFHLLDQNGESVDAKLIFPDTQVQRDYRREVFIQPVQNLSANTAYQILIDDTLQAKNGTCLDRSYRLSFTTGNSQTEDGNEKLQALGDYVITFDTSSAEPVSAGADSQGSALDDPSAARGPNLNVLSAAVVIVLLAAAAILTIIVLRIRRRRK